MICANVGDSRAVIGSIGEHSCWTVRAISRDHKPDLPGEFERIISWNGRVEACIDDYGTCVGPNRVWKKHEDAPGLAMSRALGDKYGIDVGIIAVPEITEGKLNFQDKILILASDGVWAYIDNITAVQIAGQYWKNGSAKDAAEAIVKESRKRWEMEGGIIDDITVVVVFFS